MKLPKEWNVYNTPEKTEQAITSAGTARAQKPRTLKMLSATKLVKNGKILLDIGCGHRNELFEEGLISEGFDYNGCDPFNKTKEYNLKSIHKCMNGNADLVTLNNVLNTISEKEIRKSVLKQAENALNKESGYLVILIYEGTRTKEEAKNKTPLNELKPIKTRDGFQNRMKTERYLEEVKSVFPHSKIVNVNGAKFIVASKNLNSELDLKKRTWLT